MANNFICFKIDKSTTPKWMIKKGHKIQSKSKYKNHANKERAELTLTRLPNFISRAKKVKFTLKRSHFRLM